MGRYHLETVFFCHGLPGSAADARLLATANPTVNIIALELLKFQPKDIVQALSDARSVEGATAKPESVHLVGFSIGAMAAIKIAASRPEQVSKITLISPAAPLQLGAFLPNMAGKPIFQLAMKHPGLLDLVTRIQGQVAKLSPPLMTRVLFGACGPSERALLNDLSFRHAINDAFHWSFTKHRQTYLAYVKDYVADWSSALEKVRCPVDLWHGTADTWSPIEMSVALKARLGDTCTLHEIENAEHYSTLSHTQLLSA
jgi:pimeloyl-ACP methyl ester carboxylesterase